MWLSQFLNPAAGMRYPSFSMIRSFVFGESFTVNVRSGAASLQSYEFHNVEEALDVLVSEFATDDRFVPRIDIVDYAKTRKPDFGQLPSEMLGRQPTNAFVPQPLRLSEQDDLLLMMSGATPQGTVTFGKAANRVLAVTRAERNLMFDPPPLTAFADQIRQQVSMFCMSGTWDFMGGKSNI